MMSVRVVAGPGFGNVCDQAAWIGLILPVLCRDAEFPSAPSDDEGADDGGFLVEIPEVVEAMRRSASPAVREAAARLATLRRVDVVRLRPEVCAFIN